MIQPQSRGVVDDDALILVTSCNSTTHRLEPGRSAMNPERWEQIDELFLAALEYDDEERAAFLDEECGGD